MHAAPQSGLAATPPERLKQAGEKHGVSMCCVCDTRASSHRLQNYLLM